MFSAEKYNFSSSRRRLKGIVMKNYYAVSKGYQRGIFSTWEECRRQVYRFKGARFKRFTTLQEAEKFLADTVESISHDACQKTESQTPTESLFSVRRSVHQPDSAKKALSSSEASRFFFDGSSNEDDSDTKAHARYLRLEDSESRREVCTATTYSHEYQAIPHPVTLAVVQDVFVDGACQKNGHEGCAQAGYGGYYGEGDRRNYALPLSPNEKHTNNRAELRAVIAALHQGVHDAGGSVALLMENRIDYSTPAPLYRLRVHTDSKYVVDGLTKYSKKWVKNNFMLSNRTKVQNQDLWKELILLRDGYNTCFSHQHEVHPRRYSSSNTSNFGEGFEIHHVRGHSNVLGNEMADRLAVMGSSFNSGSAPSI